MVIGYKKILQLRGTGCVSNRKGPQDLFGHTVHFINIFGAIY